MTVRILESPPLPPSRWLLASLALALGESSDPVSWTRTAWSNDDGHPLIIRRGSLADQRPPRGILVVREEDFSMSSGIIVRRKNP